MLPHIISGSSGGNPALWIFGLIGAIALAVGIKSLVRVTSLRSHGIRVPGRITGAQTGTTSKGRSTSGGTFEFTTVDGRYVHTSQPVRTNVNLLQAGREVTVAYDEADPERAEVMESVSQPVSAVAFIAVGAVFLLVAFFLLG